MAAGIFNANATDASNSTFSSINLAENVMNPSDVNNMFRAIFGAQKRWLLDLGGTVAVGGTATGITITLNESTYTGYGTSANQIPDGAVLMIETTSASAAGGTTLNVNSIGTKKVLTQAGAAIAAGDWPSGAFLLLRYDSSADSSTGAWIHVNRMAGRVKGTATNDDAVAGDVGEYTSSTIASGSAVSLTTATAANITSISLTAGDWDVWGNGVMTLGVGATLTALRAGIGTTSATYPTTPAGGHVFLAGASFTSGSPPMFNVGPIRVSISSTTTYYFITTGVFTGGTCSAFGVFSARRAR